MTARTHSPIARIVPFLLAVCLFNLPAQARYSGGSGTADDPYQIATAADLIALGETPADYDKHFVLTADIDLDPNLPGRKVFDKAVIAPGVFSYSRISPYEIGHSGTPFAGVLDGKGHTVRHLMAKIGQATTGGTVLGGLFGMLHGEVRNLGVEDVNITGSGCPVGGLVAESKGTVAECYSSGAVSGMRHVGGLTGANYGSVAQCHSMGTVNGNSRVGGLVGLNGSWDTPGVSVSQCYSTAMVNGKEEVGGLVGENGGAVTECYSSGAVSGTDAVGGLVGQNWMGVEIVTSGSIEKSHSSAVVEGTTSVGGLVGDNPGTVTQSYSTGAVSGTGQDSYGIGGLVGSNWWSGATVMQCYSTGTVSSSDQGSIGVGGLAGGNGFDCTLMQCYSTGTVNGTGQGSNDVGGLVGANGGTVIQCYSTGAVTGPDGATGGLVGWCNGQGAVTTCFWDTQTSGQTIGTLGTGRTTAEMQTAKTFLDAGWDFVSETKDGTESIWWILEGQDYPRLAWERVVFDEFEDGKAEPLWMAYEPEPQRVQLKEVHGRLEVEAVAQEQNVDAIYAADGWRLDVSKAFALRVDFHFGRQGPGDGRVTLGVVPSLDPAGMRWAELEAGCFDTGPFYLYEVRDGAWVEEQVTSRTTDGGTLYMSYNPDTDELYFSFTGYGKPNAWKTVPGLLKDRWGGGPVYVILSGGSEGMALASGDAWLDSFTVSAGVVLR